MESNHRDGPAARGVETAGHCPLFERIVLKFFFIVLYVTTRMRSFVVVTCHVKYIYVEILRRDLLLLLLGAFSLNAYVLQLLLHLVP